MPLATPTAPAMQSSTARTPSRRLHTLACITLAAAIAYAPMAQAADLSAQLATMFGSGTLANVTGPGVYRSQTQNLTMGGELSLRFPARNYQVYAYTLPGISAGCGGVDIYLGSFSHLTGSKFKQMLEAVARGYAGLLFKAALKSINPLIESVIGDLQRTLEQYSSLNANTCAMAQSLLGTTSSYTGMTAQSSCESLARAVYDEDESAAKERCGTSQSGTYADAASAAAGNATVKSLLDRDFNVVWQALADTSYSDEEKHLFMNVAGTVVLRKPGNNADVPMTSPEYAPAIETLAELMFGHAPGATADTVQVDNWMTCQDTDCLTIKRGPKSFTPLYVLVRNQLEAIRDQVTAGKALTGAQVGFINATRVPVYRMLRAGYTGDAGTTEMTDLLINRYAKTIAYDYAHLFMLKALKEIRSLVGMVGARTTVEERAVARNLASIDRITAEIELEHGRESQKLRDLAAVVDDLLRVETEMRRSQPESVRGMLDISNFLRGSRG